MREIKFRAWDKDKQEMVSWEELRTTYASFLETPNDWVVEVMQFTGLKDSRGVEIYEGDIVKDVSGFNSEVKWFEPNTGFIPFAGGCGERNADQCEVIGNIYENETLE